MKKRKSKGESPQIAFRMSKRDKERMEAKAEREGFETYSAWLRKIVREALVA